MKIHSGFPTCRELFIMSSILNRSAIMDPLVDVEPRVYPKLLIRYAESLYHDGHCAEAFSLLQKALKHPKCKSLLNGMIALLTMDFCLGKDKQRSDLVARDLMEACKLALVNRWHFAMLNDFNRNDAFRT